MLQTIVNITGINAVVQSVLLASFLFIHKRGDRTANRILGLFLMVFGILIFSTLPGASYQFGPCYKAAFLLRRTAFLLAPLFYFYSQSFVQSKFRWHMGLVKHAVPFLLLEGFTLWQALFMHRWYLSMVNEYYFHTAALLIHNIFYLILTFRYLKNRQISFKTLFSGSRQNENQWLCFFIMGFSIFWMINFHNLFLMKVLKVTSWCPYAGSINCLIPFVFFNLIALYAWIRPEIFARKTVQHPSPLDNETLNRYKTRLLTVMDSRKLYLNPDLSMMDLARELAIPHKYLSYVINNAIHLNFYDFINRYRVEESKRALIGNGNGYKTILQIAYEVGFNSKSTFNMAFKKQTGLTPSEFQRRMTRPEWAAVEN